MALYGFLALKVAESAENRRKNEERRCGKFGVFGAERNKIRRKAQKGAERWVFAPVDGLAVCPGRC